MNLTRTPFGIAVETKPGSLLPIRHIIGIGMNYAEHARQQGKGVPRTPRAFHGRTHRRS